jgi:hypothetical protein
MIDQDKLVLSKILEEINNQLANIPDTINSYPYDDPDINRYSTGVREGAESALNHLREIVNTWLEERFNVVE